MNRRATTVSKEHKITRIVAALHRRLANQIAHMRRGDTINAASGIDPVNSQGCSDFLFDRLERCVLVQTHPPTEKIIFVEIAEGEISVGNRRLHAAQSITDRTG